jgi:hypothetical protein
MWGGETSAGTNPSSVEIAWRHSKQCNVLSAAGDVKTFGPKPYTVYNQTLLWTYSVNPKENFLVWGGVAPCD